MGTKTYLKGIPEEMSSVGLSSRLRCETPHPCHQQDPKEMPHILPITLLIASNVFMTFAWYGHLKFPNQTLWLVVLVSWGIAFFEYWLAVPANRIGHEVYSAAELKTIQEVITLSVFALFSVFYLKEPLTLNHAAGFLFIGAGAFFIFKGPIPS